MNLVFKTVLSMSLSGALLILALLLGGRFLKGKRRDIVVSSGSGVAFREAGSGDRGMLYPC